MLTTLANVLAARNNTERKDIATRQGVGSAIFFGGDLVLSSIFSNFSDRILGTELRKENENKSLLNKIFPKIKPIKQILEEAEQGKISKANKRVSAGIFWANMLILMVSMGYAVPAAINKMIKHDVQKDVESQNETLLLLSKIKPIRMENFAKIK